jgi:hypothetical protein
MQKEIAGAEKVCINMAEACQNKKDSCTRQGQNIRLDKIINKL